MAARHRFSSRSAPLRAGPLPASQAELKFAVKADLVIGGRVCGPSTLRCSAARPAGGQGLGEVYAGDAQPGATNAGDITGFFLAAWVGAGSQEFSLSPIADDGTASVRLTVRQGDVDTVKFAVAFGLATPKAVRCCHLASNFVKREDLASSLAPGQERAGPAEHTLALCDNFTRNHAVLHISDAGSDLAALSRLQLRASSLRQLDDTSEAVKRLGQAVSDLVGQCAVSPVNAGTQFVQSFTYGHLSGHLLHYSLLGHVFDGIKSPVSLPLVMYNVVSAMHSTDLGFDALRAMPDEELVPRLGTRVAMSHPSCALTNIYCPDMTVAPTGQACKVRETEDIDRSASMLSFMVQNYGRLEPCAQPAAKGAPSLARAVQAVIEDQCRLALNADTFASRRLTMSLNADDCENTAQLGMQVFRGIEAACAQSRSAQELAARMAREARLSPATFAQCTDRHWGLVAEVVWRLGAMIKDGRWSLALAVVSAKGPSYTEKGAQAGEGLCGHGACVSRVRDAATGLYLHYPVEGTTYLTVDVPPPKGYATELPLKLTSGEVQTFPIETVATVLAQNVHELVGLSGHNQVLAHLRRDYGDAPPPFYKDIFYTDLKEGGGDSVGCIPLNTCPPEDYKAGSRPVFGAPFLSLSSPATMAIPITADLMAKDWKPPQRGAGSLATDAAQPASSQENYLQLMRDQFNEAYSPGLSEQTLRDYLTHLQPLRSPDDPALTSKNYATCIRSENTWAYDDPRVTAMAVQIYSALADRFNAIQAKDPASDGATAAAYGNYLSACLGITLPLPRDPKKFSLSTASNLRRASSDIGLDAAVASCVFKSTMICSRAAVDSKHLFYMCDKGEGPVHSHKVKLSLR